MLLLSHQARLSLRQFALNLSELLIVAFSRVSDLVLMFGLHLRLFKEHFLTHFVELLLRVDLHCILDAADLLLSLLQVTCKLSTLLLQILSSHRQGFNLIAHFVRFLLCFNCLGSQVLFQYFIIGFLK